MNHQGCNEGNTASRMKNDCQMPSYDKWEKHQATWRAS